MNDVLHVIDRDGPGSLLDQLSLLIGPDDGIASVGPPPEDWLAPAAVLSVHVPLGQPRLCGRQMAELAGPGMILHAWSHAAALAGDAIPQQRKAGLVWSLAQPPRGQSLRDALRLARSRGACLTVPTIACRQYLLHAGVGEDSIRLLPPAAVPVDHRLTRRSRTRAMLGLEDRHRLIVAPCDITRDGGHKPACWAFAILRQVRDDLRLLLPGRTTRGRGVLSFAQSTGHGCEIFFTQDRIPPQDCLAAADLAVFLPTRDADVYSLATAMAAGLPIVASATSDIAETAPHEQAALLTPPGDPRSAAAAILRLLEDSELARRLLARSVELAGRFAPLHARRVLEDLRAGLRAGARA